MRYAALTAASLLALAAPALDAQETRGATILGTVSDSAKVPIAGADVYLRPSGRRARTDSTGRYFISGLDGGTYVVTARKIGYAAEQGDVKISKNGRLEMNLTLQRHVMLDTVKVTAAGTCEGFSLGGFECRKKVGGGLFLDYPDIDAKDQRLTADLFRDIPGFRVTLRSTREGVFPFIGPSNGYGCIAQYVDGRPASIANPIPRRSLDIVALEIYQKADSMPIADKRYIHQARDFSTERGRCQVVIYWTVWAKI